MKCKITQGTNDYWFVRFEGKLIASFLYKEDAETFVANRICPYCGYEMSFDEVINISENGCPQCKRMWYGGMKKYPSTATMKDLEAADNGK